MSLDKSLEHFKKHQKDFAEKHHGEFVLIKDTNIIGFFSDITSAYTKAINKKLESGTFLIRECKREDEEIPVKTFSRVA